MALEPLAALSLAGTVVQFVDFSSRVVSKGRQIYRSVDGALSENIELETVTADLIELNTRLKLSLRPAGTIGCFSKAEQALEDVCNGCRGVSEELLVRLNGLKVQGKRRRWKSLRKALKTVWTKADIDATARRLAMFKNQLELQILVSLRESIDLLSVQQSESFECIDESTRQLVAMLLENRTAIVGELRLQTNKLAHMHRQTEVTVLDQHEMTRTVIIDAIHRTKRGTGESGEWPQGYSPARRRQIEDYLIRGLQYPSIKDRHEVIAQAYRDTFEWIFRSPQAGTRPWSNFTEWLRCGTGIYWINGKAASGKSTLMRFICEHNRTREQLLSWAGSSPLDIAPFFFWNSGTVEQRSQTGLLRSLLLTILDAHRELIPIVLPEEWTVALSSTALNTPNISWTPSKLRAVFRALVDQEVLPMKLCLFIDGLDEYDGDHADIVELFKSIVLSSNVKVCLSSRPLPVFEHAFKALQGLRLQDLTFNDISHFVSDKLWKNDQMQRLAQGEPERAPKLVEEIVLKAQGVFLWVDLVVRALITGLQNWDRISDLQKRVELLPPDLENLYKHMLMHIDKFYLEQASRLFQLVRVAREQSEIEGLIVLTPLTILALSMADEEDEDLAVKAEIKPLSEEEIASKCESTEGRIKSRCAGLLEIYEYRDDGYQFSGAVKSKADSRVQYLHRTVRDFLEEPDTWSTLLRCTDGTQFDPSTSWLRACVLRLKATVAKSGNTGGQPHPDLPRSTLRIAFDAMHYARRAYHATGGAQVSLMDELDRTMTHLSGCTITGRHWGCSIWPDVQEIGRREDADTFVSLTVEFSLFPYVSTKLRQNESLLKGKIGRPLLDYVTLPSFSPGHFASSEMVSLLLQHGADPNQRYTKWTAWENALRYVYETTDQLDQDQWVRIFELLIENGADRNACYDGFTPTSQEIEKLSALFIVNQKFDHRADKVRQMLAGNSSESVSVATGAGGASRQQPPSEEDDEAENGTMKPPASTISWRSLLCCGLAR